MWIEVTNVLVWWISGSCWFISWSSCASRFLFSCRWLLRCERLLCTFSNDLELVRSSVASLHLNCYILCHFKELKSLGERKGGHFVFPQFQMQDSQIVEVELRMKLLALLVHEVVLRTFILLPLWETWLVELIHLALLWGRLLTSLEVFFTEEKSLNDFVILALYMFNQGSNVNQ